MLVERKLTIEEVQNILFDLFSSFHKFCDEHKIQYYMIGGTLLGAIRHKGFIPWDDDIDVAMMRSEYEKFLKICHLFNNVKYEVVNHRINKKCNFCLTRIYINDTRINYPHSPFKLETRLYFDIFPLDNVPSEEIKRKKQEKKLLRYKKYMGVLNCFFYKGNIAYKILKYIYALALKIRFFNTLPFKMEKVMTTYNQSNSEYICSMHSQYSYEKQIMNKKIYGSPTLYMFRDKFFYGPELFDEYLSKLYGFDYMRIPNKENRRVGFDIYKKEE